MYTIGQVSEMFDLPVSTLRYYDKEGLFPELNRTSGIRQFTEKEVEALRVIECLKKTGLQIKTLSNLCLGVWKEVQHIPKEKSCLKTKKSM